MKYTRKEFIRNTTSGMIALGSSAIASADTTHAQKQIDAREYLSKIVYTRQNVDDWFAGRAFPFGKYDGELGWLLRDARFPDGVDGSTSTYRYGRYDERQTVNYADLPCRINTYGNSFTQGHQVSDGETWQEVLAAHLGEPIRNFGVGAWSVYQAYLRMLREEARAPAETLILNIYDDDHRRNLDAWLNIRFRIKAKIFLFPTKPYLEVNLSSRECKEHENPRPTQESFYNLCDLDWIEERFRDDFVLGIMLAHTNAREGNPDRAYDALAKLTKTHGITTRIDESKTASAVAGDLHTQAALLSTMEVVEKVEAFAKTQGKQVLYILSFPSTSIARRVKEGTRFDQPFVDFLKKKNLPFVDLMEAHLSDFAQFSLPIEEYLKRYYIGHYTPRGNFFSAFAIKDKLVKMLDPKPMAYQPAHR